MILLGLTTKKHYSYEDIATITENQIQTEVEGTQEDGIFMCTYTGHCLDLVSREWRNGREAVNHHIISSTLKPLVFPSTPTTGTQRLTLFQGS